MKNLHKGKLPDKLSDLLELALDDLAKTERLPRYVIDMATWHAPMLFSEQCAVCLAGCVLARTVGLDPMEDVGYMWRSLGDEIGRKTDALEDMRVGDLHMALRNMRQKVPKGLPETIDITPYATDRRRFKTELRQTVKLLREYKL